MLPCRAAVVAVRDLGYAVPSASKMRTPVPSCRLVLGLLIIACGASSACLTPGHYVKDSMEHYEVGNYNLAARACWKASEDEQYMNDKAHVRYLVYCGLAHYRLGHRAQAQPLLVSGEGEYLKGKSNWLKPATADELYKALDDLEGRPHARPTRDSFRGR